MTCEALVKSIRQQIRLDLEKVVSGWIIAEIDALAEYRPWTSLRPEDERTHFQL